MARTWFGEIPSCCSLTVLLGPAWVLLRYALQTIVYELEPTRSASQWIIIALLPKLCEYLQIWPQ